LKEITKHYNTGEFTRKISQYEYHEEKDDIEGIMTLKQRMRVIRPDNDPEREKLTGAETIVEETYAAVRSAPYEITEPIRETSLKTGLKYDDY